MTQPGRDHFVTGLTDDQLQAIEMMAENIMIELLTQVADHYADLLKERATVLIAAADDVPGEPPTVNPEDLAGIARATSEAIAETMLPLVAEIYLSGAANVRAEMIKATGISIPPVRSIDAIEYLATAAPKFAGIGDELWQTVRSELAAGFDEGESIPELADRVRKSAGVTARSATLVARTSVIDAANMGSLSTAKASGLEMEKEWMATPSTFSPIAKDPRTRPTHWAANGDRVPLHGNFTVGGYPADRPGDPALPPQERDNCRCTVGYVIPEESVSKIRPEQRVSLIESERVEESKRIIRAPDRSVRRELADAKTVDEINSVATVIANKATGRKDIRFDLTGADPQIARETAEGIIRGFERYPKSPASQIGTFGPGGAIDDPRINETMAHGGAVGRDRALLIFNVKSLGDPVKYRKDIKAGFNAKRYVTENPMDIALHEFGHSIDENFTKAGAKPLAVREYLKDRGKSAKGGVYKETVRSEISGYAAESPSEMGAEAFADVMINGENASELSRRVFRAIDDGYASKTGSPIQRPAPAPDIVLDPAIKMTVIQLKDAAKSYDAAHGTRFTRLLAGQKKAQIVDTLRHLEVAHGVRLTGLPEWKAPRAPKSVVAPIPSTGIPARGASLTGTLDERWSKLLPVTPSEGIRVQDLRVSHNALGDYWVRHGTAWRDADGAAYLVEHGELEFGASWVSKAVTDMRSAHAEIYGAAKYNKSYAWLLDRNPADAHWAKEYNIPNFRSAATAANGNISLWSRTTYPNLDVGLIRHETGHNIDDAIGRKSSGAESQAWADANAADAATTRYILLNTTVPGHQINEFPRAGKNYPHGVTEYGKSSPLEDFAESVRLYQSGPVADGHPADLNMPEVKDVYFREIFPNRAAILDGLFPDIAAAQKAAISARGIVAHEAGAAKRAAARTRMAVIDRARDRAGALAELDEVTAATADTKILRERLDFFVGKKIMTKAEGTALAKVATTGDRMKVSAALGRLATKAKTTISAERAGDIVDFDPDRMITSSTGRQIAKGAKVRVMRAGASFDYNGEIVELERITVRPTTTEELARIREAKAADARTLAEFAAKAEGVDVDQVRILLNRANLPAAARSAIEKVIGNQATYKRTLASEMRKAKIKPEGKVSTTAVKFDPETMEGSGLAPGTKVRVVARGYSTEIDGERVILTKATVEQIAPKIVAPKNVPEDALAVPRLSVSPAPTGAAKAVNTKYGSTAGANKPRYKKEGLAGEKWTPEMGPPPQGAYEENCSNVVGAFELRMRGYDVEAAPSDILDRHGYATGRTYEEMDDLFAESWSMADGRPHGRSFGSQEWRSFAELDSEIEVEWPEGGRGVIMVTNHIFNAIKVGGKARYIEAQYNANPSRIITSAYKRKYASGGAKLIRLDDLIPTKKILQSVSPVGG